MMIVEVYYQDLAIVYFANLNPARKPRLLPVADGLACGLTCASPSTEWTSVSEAPVYDGFLVLRLYRSSLSLSFRLNF